MIKQILGYALIVAPFIVIFAISTEMNGFWETIIIFAIAVSICAMIALGVRLTLV